MNLRDLKLRLRALVSRRAVERELNDELAFHLECETQKLMREGMGPTEARRRAMARFGPVPLAADQCRDERRIGIVETLVRDISFALRTFRRAPLVAVTVVATIALGLGVVAVAFTFFNAFFFRVDAVRNPAELFALERPVGAGTSRTIPFTRIEYEAIRRETDVFVDVAAARPSVLTRVEGRASLAMFVSGNYFDMLGVTAVRGRTLTQADNDGSGHAVIVLSHQGWEKLFATDPAVIGRQVLINGQAYEVVGIAPRDFRGLRFDPPDYWAPLALIDRFPAGEKPNLTWVDVIGRLKSGASPQAAAAALTAWASAQPRAPKPENDNGIVHVTLRESRGVMSKDRGAAMAVFVPIFFAFGLILMIGSANVANLLLARGLSRHREIGIRLSLGATRGRIVRQLLTENFLLALAAAALGFLVSRALLAGSIHLTLSILPPESMELVDLAVLPSDWRVLAFLFGGALVSTVMFALGPALHATRLEPLRAMRGEVMKDARPSRMRQILIASQVTASALLLVCASVFLRSTYAASTANPGVRTGDTVVVGGITEAARPALLRSIKQDSSIASVAASWPEPMESGAFVEASAGDMKLGVGCKLVSLDYFDLLGINLVRGRLFAADERGPAAGVVVISDSVAQRFWPNGDALGQTLRFDRASGEATKDDDAPRIPAQLFTVIGIVRDVRSALKTVDFTYSGIYLPTTPEQAKTSLVLRVHGDPGAARRTLLDALTRIDPALGHVSTMKMMAAADAAVLKLLFWMAMILGSLALVLTISGLFSVLSYIVEQRRTEIGVRMALGALPRDIIRLVLSQSMRPIAVGVVAGGSLAVAVATALLATPFAEMIGSFVRAFDPVAYAAGLTIIVATCLVAALVPARRAARINPIATLRAD